MARDCRKKQWGEKKKVGGIDGEPAAEVKGINADETADLGDVCMITSWDASSTARVCGGVACNADEVIVSIDSGSDEHCVPRSAENVGRRLAQAPPVLSAAQGTKMLTIGVNRIGYHWMSESAVPVAESRSDMVACDTKKFVFSTVKMRRNGMIIHHEEGDRQLDEAGWRRRQSEDRIV